jgi:hypothetical protein
MFTAHVFLKRLRVVTAFPDLNGIKSDISQLSHHRFRFVPIRIASAFGRMWVRCSSEVLFAFGLHSSVQHDPDELSYHLKSLGRNLLQQLGWYGKIALVGGFSFCGLVASKDIPDLPLFDSRKITQKKFSLLAKSKKLSKRMGFTLNN